jgi:hypothetical protein
MQNAKFKMQMATVQASRASSRRLHFAFAF